MIARISFFILFLLGQSIAWAAEPVPAIASIQKQIPELTIDAISNTDIPGLFELQSHGNIYYINHDGSRLIAQGHIFDTQNKLDLTAQRLEAINTIDWSSLPLDAAIVSGDPKGVEVAIFTDPDCPFCRQLEKELISAKGIKIYTFLLPLTSLHPDAAAKAETIWCSRNQHGALRTIMVEDKTLSPKTCEHPLASIQEVAKKLRIRGTPTLIAKDGRKRSGAMSAEELHHWLTNSN